MKRFYPSALAILFMASLALSLACATPNNPSTPVTDPPFVPGTAYAIAGHEVASQAVLRSIPTKYIDDARTKLHIAYQHTSHGTHVAYGLFGLQDFKTGDRTLFGITNDEPTADKLDFHDYAIYSAETPTEDLSQGVDDLDANGDPAFVRATRQYLDKTENKNINVVMWSWCSISGHNTTNYINGIKKLVAEYGPGGTKIGSGAGKRSVVVTFILMTGHAEAGNNVGSGRPRDQAKLITVACATNGWYCLDYYSIDTHAMDGKYYEDAGDDGDSVTYDNSSASAGRSFYEDWQNAKVKGVDWFENKEKPDGAVKHGEHNTQHITANRKAYAMWYILARIAGWDGK